MAIASPPRAPPAAADDDDDADGTAPPQDSRPLLQQSASASVSDSARHFLSENPHLRRVTWFRKAVGDAINHPKVQLVVIVLIMINAIMMGLATFDFVMDNPDVDRAFEITDQAFLVIFTIELVMQFIFMGFGIFRDGWLVFDFIIIVSSWSLMRVDGVDSLQIIRAFRIFRALRIITRIKTMRNLVTALFDVMPRLGLITALLCLIFYIFAVLFTTLFGPLDLPYHYFSRLDHSLMTLFVFMTMEWSDITRELMAQVWWAWAPCIIFIMVTGFIVFNLIIAVVCDAVAVVEMKGDLDPDGGALPLGDGMGDGTGDAGDDEDAPSQPRDRATFHGLAAAKWA